MHRGTAESYRVFVRNWWRRERYGPIATMWKLAPDPGARKTTIARGCTLLEAREIAQRWNAEHKPGPLSRKAEFESE